MHRAHLCYTALLVGDMVVFMLKTETLRRCPFERRIVEKTRIATLLNPVKCSIDSMYRGSSAWVMDRPRTALWERELERYLRPKYRY